MKAAGYIRVSTDNQVDHLSLPYQAEEIRRRCEEKGYDLVEIIEDAGYSGTTENRPGLKRLLGLMQDKAFEVLVAYDSSRLARNPFVKGIIKETARRNGIRIEYIAEKFEDSDLGDFSEGVMDLVNWLFSRQTSKKVYETCKYKAEKGQLMPTYARLGYDWSELDEKGHKAKGAKLVVNQKEAEVVRIIFDLYEKMSQHKVARWLNEHGYRLPCKSPAWREKYNRTERLFAPKDINDIVSDPLYVGMVTWGNTSRDPRRKPVPQTHYFPELQIISFEQFNRVQAIKSQRRKLPGRSNDSPYIYSGVLRCPHCGGPVVGKRQYHPEYDYQLTKRYECRNYHQYGKVACRGWTALETTVSRAVIPFLADLFGNRLNLRRHIEEEARNILWEQHEGKARKLEAEIQAAKETLKRVQKLAIEGILTPEEARGPVLEARERIEKAEKKLESLKRQVILEKDLLEQINLFCSDIEGNLARLRPEALRTVVRNIFKWFSIGKRGYGRTQKAWIEAYEFHEDVKELLAQQSTTATDGPIFEMV